MAGKKTEAHEPTSRARIVAAATAEFLAHGFADASLRRIASEAGVTTGAIYGYFSSKADLLDAVVSGPADELYRRYVASQEEFYERPVEEQSFKAMQRSESALAAELYDYIMDNRAAFLIVLTKSAGTRWEDYLDRFTDIETVSTERYAREMRAKGIAVRSVSEPTARTLAYLFFRGFFQPLLDGMSREQALSFAADYGRFFHAGYAALMEPQPGMSR